MGHFLVISQRMDNKSSDLYVDGEHIANAESFHVFNCKHLVHIRDGSMVIKNYKLIEGRKLYVTLYRDF